MANQFLKLRRSSVPGKIPDTGSLDYGEIALNTYDGLAFMKRSGSNGEEVVTIGSKSGSFTGSLQGTASWAEHALTASSADDFLVRGTLTAQTIVVQVITSSQELVTGSLTVEGSLNALGGATGSFSGSFTGSISAVKGTATHLPFFIENDRLADSTVYQVSTSSIAINETSVTANHPEALYVFQTHPTSFNVITGKGNLNNYLQINIQNTNQGATASSDLVATANNGSEDAKYINMGINNENFAGFLGGPNDAYLFATASNLWLGSTHDGGKIFIFNSSSLDPIITINDGVEITGSLNAPDITGSLLGTASYALTASYVNNLELNPFRIVTGSVTASVNVDPDSIFLIKSGSLQFINISNSGDTTINSNLFIVKNLTTQQPVLTVSQSVVQFTTHSSDPVGSTNAGSIWFTSTAMYVGLE